MPPDAVPKRIQLQLIGTESEDRLDKKICPWDAIKMYEFEDGLEVSEFFYDMTKIKEVNGLLSSNAEEKERLEEKQADFTNNRFMSPPTRIQHGKQSRYHGNGFARRSPVLLATRMRTEDMLPIAAKLDDIGYWSLETWGGATFDATLRYLKGSPWERLRRLRAAMPKTRFQMLLRGQNVVGYHNYPDDIVQAFVAARRGQGHRCFSHLRCHE